MDPIERLMQQVVQESKHHPSIGEAITKLMVQHIAETMIILHAAPAGIIDNYTGRDAASSLTRTIDRVSQALKDGVAAVPASQQSDGALVMTHAIRCAAFDLIKACDEALACGH